jgi:hypothetical protein
MHGSMALWAQQFRNWFQPYPSSAANAGGFLLASLSKTPRIETSTLPQKSAPRRFRSRLTTTRELSPSLA